MNKDKNRLIKLITTIAVVVASAITVSAAGGPINEVMYNAANHSIKGRYAEPAPPDDDHYFAGWSTTKENADAGTVDFNPKPEELNNPDLKKISDNETKHVYAVWKEKEYAKYAVMIYGIGQDTLKDGSTGGLTFGPATGKNFVNSYQSHTVDAETAQQSEKEKDTNHHNVIIGTDAGTDESGNVYRCIHFDNWETIIFWNKKDPHVYDKCVTNNCTHAVRLTPSDEAKAVTFTGTPQTGIGDGVGVLFEQLVDEKSSNVSSNTGDKDATYKYRNLQYNGMAFNSRVKYGTSRIRAILNGKDDTTGDSSATGGGIDEYTADTCVLSAFPKNLQNAIGDRAVRYAQHYQQYSYLGANADGEAKMETVYDKLWLFSIDEIYGLVPDEYDNGKGKYYNFYDMSNVGESGRKKGSGQYARTEALKLEMSTTSSTCTNGSKLYVYDNNIHISFWLRSLYGGYDCTAVISQGGLLDSNVSIPVNTPYCGIAPGFTLSRK